MEVKSIEFEELGQHWGSCQRRAGWHNVLPGYTAGCPCCEEPPSCPICKRVVLAKGKRSGLEQSLNKGKAAKGKESLDGKGKGKEKGSGLEHSLDQDGKGKGTDLPQSHVGKQGKGKGEDLPQSHGKGKSKGEDLHGKQGKGKGEHLPQSHGKQGKGQGKWPKGSRQW